VVFGLTLLALSLAWFGLWTWRTGGVQFSRRPPAPPPPPKRGFEVVRFMLMLAILASPIVLCGCGGSSEPDEIWCEPGTGPVQLVYPRAISYDAKDDTFFVIDRLAHINHIDRAGKPLGEWKMPEMQQGKPVGVSVGPDGNVYVPDTHYHRVIVYTPKGEEIRRWGSFGHEPGQFIYPTDIDFDAKGNIFVAEYGDNDRVQVFAPDGKYLYQFGKFGQGDGEFMRPQAILIEGDTIYITDHANHRINVFKTDGTFVRNMCKRGSGLGELRFPYGLAKDSRGRLIVSEFGNNRVQLIDKTTGQGIKTLWRRGRSRQPRDRGRCRKQSPAGVRILTCEAPPLDFDELSQVAAGSFVKRVAI
jgi:DNA-binding beta-propeller fold protein YncE